MEQNENRKKTAQCKAMSKCIPHETAIGNVRLAMAYVPYQKLCTLFTPIEGLKRGTVFPELYSPYEGEDKKSSPYELSKKGRNL
ncbi:MAG TPA: spore coat associated protein CotJA [Clostridiaceae bacterium]